MPRNETLRDQIATIIQEGGTSRQSADDTAGRVIALIVPALTQVVRRRIGAPYKQVKFEEGGA